MPCTKCGSLLVLLNDKVICPTCEGIKFLDRQSTIDRLAKNIEETDQAVFSEFKKRVSKNKMLAELAWQRESFSRNFFTQYQGLDLNAFMSFNLLIFRIMKEPYFDARKNVDYNSVVKEAVRAYKTYVQIKSEYLLFREGYAEAIESKPKILIIPTEKYFHILNTYQDNDILEESKANERAKEYLPIYEDIVKNRPFSPISYTPEQFIEQFYFVINQLYSGLLRNEIYDEVFGLLEKYSEINLTPGGLMDFVNSFPINANALYHDSVNSFLRKASRHFGITEPQARKALMFYEHNCGIFPLFVLLNGRVYISHRTAFLLYILLHAILYKDLFDKETEKRSKEFEKEQVKSVFEEIGWHYFPNVTDKKQASLEIDGIATFEKQLLVVECKGWQLYPFYEYKNIQSYLERDIKGIVDGTKFTRGQPHKIPSLIEKVEFVKTNMSKLGFDAGNFTSVSGLVVLRSFPPISEYKGINVLSIKDIPKNFTVTNSSFKEYPT